MLLGEELIHFLMEWSINWKQINTPSSTLSPACCMLLKAVGVWECQSPRGLGITFLPAAELG